MADQYLHGSNTIEKSNGLRPVRTAKSAVIGIVGTAPAADNTVFPVNEPVHIQTAGDAALIGATGTLPDALDGVFDQRNGLDVVLVRVEEGVDADATMSNIIGASGAMTGVHALAAAQSELGIRPRILSATGFTSQRPGDAANPVVAELLGIAEGLRATTIADGPNTDKADAVTYRADWGSRRVFVVDPAVKAFRDGATIIEPASARVAGLTAKTDYTDGFHHSPSNKIVNGITGTARPIPFGLNNHATEANFLNENEVATIINHDGYRLWGNRTTASDPLWAFLPVARTVDMVYDAIEEATMWALDKPFSVQLLVDIAEQVNAYLRFLSNPAIGALIGGKCWLDPALNTPAQFLDGKSFISFDLEPPAPNEHMTFVAYRNAGYYTELAEDAAREIALQAA
ncbi:MAG: phage tail sheath subtilisin-like domain-containing protein [Roseitalea sp.]|nr:phage tail sheath subtilisin-like domain-containing protein [Roseitalea sp.]MBO6950976.1 phage tail sheath subtilisin-like domain-containing protein [Rhizobiaceae bacterium]MBO6591037.1 phage tail sheath subtilisin-like domain-containing protein [Roseitalea sp.]MBO6599705.1 phage tail sheath subtilisin-like domain-containing protein [Roseitalea sp.]MBO6611461.1 phage tail sheath subtilisin-like domain-containing protein [Roseitalea sp.]